MNYKMLCTLTGVTTLLLLSTGNVQAQVCNQQYNWTSWQSFTGNSATGIINNNGQPVHVTMTSNFNFGWTPVIFGYFNFSGFTGGLPNTTVPATTWAAGTGGTTTMCFDQVVKNPVLVFSSLGAAGAGVTLHFSVPYQVLYPGINMTYTNDTTLTGAEGYDVLLFPGDFTCLTIFFNNTGKLYKYYLGIESSFVSREYCRQYAQLRQRYHYCFGWNKIFMERRHKT